MVVVCTCTYCIFCFNYWSITTKVLSFYFIREHFHCKKRQTLVRVNRRQRMRNISSIYLLIIHFERLFFNVSANFVVSYVFCNRSKYRRAMWLCSQYRIIFCYYLKLVSDLFIGNYTIYIQTKINHITIL